MNGKLFRIYFGSVMAFSMLHKNAPSGGTYTEHKPLILLAHSINEAAEKAKVFAFESWPIDETWYGHQAAIIAVSKEFYDNIFEADDLDLLDLSDEGETGDAFLFDI
jgi:hypothetical protein